MTNRTMFIKQPMFSGLMSPVGNLWRPPLIRQLIIRRYLTCTKKANGLKLFTSLKALQKVSRVHLICFLIMEWWAFIVSKFSTGATYFILFWCTLMISDQNSSFETDDNHSSRSTSDCILIEFYQRLREESLTAISRHVKDLRVSDCIAFIKGHYLCVLLFHKFCN